MSDSTPNFDEKTLQAFGREWTRFDQSRAGADLLRLLFSEYFAEFPWERLPPGAVGADIGCGSGRWARFVAERVGTLHCIDASAEALAVARAALSTTRNVVFHEASVDDLPFEEGSLDFAYSLGVLHHLPDTAAGFQAIARSLRKGAPLLVYLYYAFDNRSRWYRLLWRISDGIRQAMVRLPPGAQFFLCDAIAALVYWPLAVLARIAESAGFDVGSFPLTLYRRRDFYSMRTDARDRFGTPLEKRFRAEEIRRMMQDAGLEDIRIPERPPYWCAIGIKRSPQPERSGSEASRGARSAGGGAPAH